MAPPGGGGPKIHMFDYVMRVLYMLNYINDHVDFWPPPSPRGATKNWNYMCVSFGIDCTCVGEHLTNLPTGYWGRLKWKPL